MYPLWELIRPIGGLQYITKVKEYDFANSFTIPYLGKALMWYTLITQRGEVSGFVRILHQRLGCHMTQALPRHLKPREEKQQKVKVPHKVY